MLEYKQVNDATPHGVCAESQARMGGGDGFTDSGAGWFVGSRSTTGRTPLRRPKSNVATETATADSKLADAFLLDGVGNPRRRAGGYRGDGEGGDGVALQQRTQATWWLVKVLAKTGL
jgi:hypothetical protein